jgi:amino acid adenylation domain-containing protein
MLMGPLTKSTWFDTLRVISVKETPPLPFFHPMEGEVLTETDPKIHPPIRPNGRFLQFKKEEIEQSIPKRFEQQVIQYPQHLAVKTKRHALTYQALNQHSNRIAHSILEKRGEGEETVLLLCDHGAPLIAAILGVLKAGKIYVPVDPLDPKSRIETLLEETQAKLIITDHPHLSLSLELAKGMRQLLNIDESDLGSGSPENPDLPLPPDALACLFYTSGSTGRPKGVMDNHRNVLHNIMRYTNSLCICPEDRLTLLQSCSFSGSVSSLFCSLLNGATVFPYDLRKEGMGIAIAHWLIQAGITIYHSVPTIFRSFLTGDLKFQRVRVIRLEGDAASRIDVELYRKYFESDCLLVNGLGATETGITRQYFINKSTVLPGGIVPIGYSVEDMEVLVLDDEGKGVGINTIGEIVVKSQYLSPGYWRNPELTRLSFLNDPDGGNKRIYKTGDRGRLRPDGCLEYLGRKDFQLKVGGHMVEAAEVERVFLGLTNIKDTAVVSHEDRNGEARLVAYIVPMNDQTPTVRVLRQELSERLPDYMIPSTFVVLNRLPLNSNGKVDRRALPPPDPIRLRPSGPFLAPRNPLEQQLARIWEKELGVKPIGVEDNFFELGGTSLIAAKIFAKIRKTMRRNLPLTVFVKSPTIEQLANQIQKEEDPLSEPALLPIQPYGSKPPFICVHGHGGEGFSLVPLARYFEKDQPFYGFQSIGIQKKQFPLTRIESMAAHYVAELRSLQPVGPYYLAGECFGGIVAFEMAHQLLGQEEKVAFLALIGMTPTDFANLLPPSLIQAYHRHCSWVQRLKRKWGLLTTLGTREKIARIKKDLYSKIINPYQKWTWAIPYRVFSLIGRPLPRIFWNIAQTNKYAYGRYVPKVYSGRVTLFLEREIMDLSRETDSDWGKIAAHGVSAHALPGDHLTVTSKGLYAELLAGLLQNCLTESQTQATQQLTVLR